MVAFHYTLVKGALEDHVAVKWCPLNNWTLTNWRARRRSSPVFGLKLLVDVE